MIFKVPVMHFQKLFTESKKLSRLSCSGATKLALMRTFSVKCMDKSAKILTFLPENVILLAPDHFLNPIFGMMVAFDELYKRYLGFVEVLNFLPLFGASKLRKLTSSGKKSIF